MDIFEKYDETKSNGAKAFKKILTEGFPYFLLLINIAFMVVNSLFELGVQNPFSEMAIIKTFLNCATSTMAYACFVAYGESTAKKTLKGYLENCRVWGETSDRIRTGANFEAFLAYCKEQVEKEREDIRLSYVTNHTRLSVTEFNEQYRLSTKAERWRRYKEGKITFTEYWYLNKACGNIKVKPINPLLLLCGAKLTNINDAGRAEGGNAVKTIALKPLTMLLSTIVCGSITCIYSGIADGSAVFQMFISAFLILASALMGYSSGVGNVNKTNDAIKSRIIFLERFEKSIKQ